MGPTTSTLELTGPDPEWPARFEVVRAELAGALGPAARRIEHIGSTAVPGMVAKPTIDVLVVVDRTADVLARVDQLADLGFEHRPEAWADPTRHVFLRRVVDGRRTHHLHVVPEGAREIDDYLALRDFLRTHPAEAAAYGEHKLALQREHGGDRAAYVAAKPAYVDAVLIRAREWAARSELQHRP